MYKEASRAHSMKGEFMSSSSRYQDLLSRIEGGGNGTFGGLMVEKIVKSLKKAREELDSTGVINVELLDTIPNAELREEADQIFRDLMSQKEQEPFREQVIKGLGRRQVIQLPEELRVEPNPFQVYKLEDVIKVLQDEKHGRFGGGFLTEKNIGIVRQLLDGFKNTGEFDEGMLKQISNRELREGVKFAMKQEKDRAGWAAQEKAVRARIERSGPHRDQNPEGPVTAIPVAIKRKPGLWSTVKNAVSNAVSSIGQ